MKINTDGLIIKRGSVGENDRLVTVLTRDLGVIRAFVHGANKVKGKTVSATDALSYSKFTVSKNRDTYTISEITPVEVFFDLRSDIERLSLAQYFCEVTMHLAVEGEAAEEPLRLILNCLYLLMKQTRPMLQIKAIFELRMMTLAGFMPDLSGCAGCGNEQPEPAWFSYAEGTVKCDACGGGGTLISGGVLAAMRHIVGCDFERLFNFELTPDALKALAAVTERYVITHCDCSFTALNFYKSL